MQLVLCLLLIFHSWAGGNAVTKAMACPEDQPEYTWRAFSGRITLKDFSE